MKIKQTNKSYHYSRNNGYWFVTIAPMQKTALRQYTLASADNIYFKFDKSINLKRHKHDHYDKNLCYNFAINYKR